MIIKHGNMFDASKADMIFCTTNGVVTKYGALIMGAGAARNMKERHAGIENYFGSKLKAGQVNKYGLIYGKSRGAFQTKYHYNDKSDLDLIMFSAQKLAALASQHPHLTFAVNFPGIGCGGLSRAAVTSAIETILPNNIEVWLLK